MSSEARDSPGLQTPGESLEQGAGLTQAPDVALAAPRTVRW